MKFSHFCKCSYIPPRICSRSYKDQIGGSFPGFTRDGNINGFLVKFCDGGHKNQESVNRLGSRSTS
jgi:hypothetical protein